MSSFKVTFKSQLTDVDTTAMEDLGAIRMDENGVHKYVQFGATRTTNVSGALVAGDVVCYVLGTTADLDLMTLVDEANTAVGAGVVEAAVAATGGPFYGWVKIKGTVTLSGTPAGSPAAGDELTPASASAKSLTKRATDNGQSVGVLVDATNFVMNCNFPY
jgi:hypothetical protein